MGTTVCRLFAPHPDDICLLLSERPPSLFSCSPERQSNRAARALTIIKVADEKLKIHHRSRRLETFRLKKRKGEDPVEFIIEIKRAPWTSISSSRGQSLAPNEIRTEARLPSAVVVCNVVYSGMETCWNEGKQGGGEEEREEDLCRFVHERGHTYRLVNRVLNGLAGIDFR